MTTSLILLLLNTAIAQQIVKDKPTPSRAEGAPLGYAYGRDYSTSDVTKVVVIGSGTPAADPRHSEISTAVVVNGQPYIFDCGPGFWRNSQVSTPAYGGKIAALEPKDLTRLFLTHLHFDHTEGLSEFMLAPWIYYRDIGPHGFGLTMIIVGLLTLLLAGLDHRWAIQTLKAQYPVTEQYPRIPRSRAGLLAALIAILGVLALISMLLRE